MYINIVPGGNSVDRLMARPKWELVAYARQVQAALPDAGVIAYGTKADIAYSIAAAIANNPPAEDTRPTRKD